MTSLVNVYAAFTVIATGGLLFGYIIGINSNVITKGQLKCPDGWTGPVGDFSTYGYGQCYNLDAFGQGVLSSLNLVGATISSAICFKYADIMGRRFEVKLGAALYLIGAAVAALSPVLWGIYVGFLIYGLGIGFAMHAAPVYIAEISPANVRGRLVSAKEMVIVVGMFIGFAMGAIFSGWERAGWRAMVMLGCVFAVFMEVGITFIPNSPRWLVLAALKGSQSRLLSSERSAEIMDEARRALQWFRRAEIPEEVEDELQAIHLDASQASAGSAAQASCAETLRYPKPLVIGCGLVFLQQVTGQPSVLYFATNIFKSAGFASLAAAASVLVGFVKLIATLFTVFRVDQYGRRSLLMAGIALMIVALLILGTAFSFRRCDLPDTSMSDCPEDSVSLPRGWAISTVFALMIYVSGYQVGFGPISWLMISEIFPLGVRGAALSTAAMVNFGSNIMMTLCQTALMNALTPSGTFFSYCVLSIVSFIFVLMVVPETKGRTLEDIEAEMTGRKSRAPPLSVEASSASR